MSDRSRASWLPATLVGLGLLAAGWAALVFATGGFVARVGALRISSRSPRTALVLALVCLAAAFVLSTREERRRALPAIWSFVRRADAAIERAWPRLAPIVAGCAALATVAVGLTWGTDVAAGADAYGYASQAELWARGNLRIEEPLMSHLRWGFSANTLAPLGYTPSRDSKALVPFYSPGLPMLMGLFRRLGGPVAVYYVVPLLGGLAVWATYLLGVRCSNRSAGAAASLLMAASPPFLSMLLLPMSDVPATAWWALALALGPFDSRRAALGAGLAAAAAIATRPNLVPLAVVPGALLLWRAWLERFGHGPRRAARPPVRARRPARPALDRRAEQRAVWRVVQVGIRDRGAVLRCAVRPLQPVGLRGGSPPLPDTADSSGGGRAVSRDLTPSASRGQWDALAGRGLLRVHRRGDGRATSAFTRSASATCCRRSRRSSSWRARRSSPP